MSVCVALAPGAWSAELPQFVDLGAEVDLPGLHGGPMVPVFLDVDGDGRVDPLWMSHEGSVVLKTDGDGVSSLVSLDTPAVLFQPGGPVMVSGVLDADRDGNPEILLVGSELRLFKPDGALGLDQVSVPVPQLPAASVADMAIGDLNQDGWPDAVLALGISAPELIEMRGHPDVVLLNLGHGRFQVHPLAPVARGYSNGVTLADLDGDRRLDVIESFDGSVWTGKSRILMNRTPPGAMIPVFEEADDTYDVGTFGMGVAVADVNGDEHLDIYATSIASDLLSMGGPDGSWKDETRVRGLLHQWAPVGFRSQWSPSFADLNGDGHLDLVVRHGDQGVAAISGAPGLKIHGPDLVYAGDEDGHFTRAHVPFDPDGPNHGRMAVVGDIDADGRPEVALGGKLGSAAFWRNVTPVSEDHRTLTLGFATTVSAWPPVGAVVEATCDGVIRRRHLTSGGKLGGVGAWEINLAWPGCSGAAEVQVQWPSGATSTEVVPPETSVWIAQEPAWWSSSETEADVVQVNPANAGVDQVCVGHGEGDADSCCSASDGACELAVEGDASEPPWIQAGSALPMRLPLPVIDWVVITDPQPVRPGSEVTVHALHVGHPALLDEDTKLLADGEFREWSILKPEIGVFSALFDAPLGITELPLALPPFNTSLNSPWAIPTGAALDPLWVEVDAYPYSVIGGVTEPWYWSMYSTCVRRSLSGELLDALELSRPDGTAITELTASLMPGAVARARMQVSWEQLSNVTSLSLRDLRSGFSIEVPVPEPLSLEQAADAIHEVRGGLFRTRLTEGGDASGVLLALMDAEGRRLPPETELVTLEADGAQIAQAPQMFSNTYNLIAFITTDPGEGPGEVRVRGTDGRLLGTFPFERIAKGAPDLSLEDSSADLEVVEVSEGEALEATHRLRFIARNAFLEVLGAEVRVTIDVVGGSVVDGPSIHPQETGFSALIQPDPGSVGMTISLYAEELLVDTWEVDVDPSLFPDPVDPAEDGALGDAHSGDGDVDAAVDASNGDLDAEPATVDNDGCGGCSSSERRPGSMLWLFVVSLILLSRRRRVFG